MATRFELGVFLISIRSFTPSANYKVDRELDERIILKWI
jgi:hypothetical protein